MSFDEAIAKAQETGEDLVEVAGQADPPVCRIMNYGKYVYEKNKRQKQARKKQHLHKLKEIKFHPNIDGHDFDTKINHAIAFLDKGYKVKVSMYFRGREMAHTDLGIEVMDRVAEACKEHGHVEGDRRRAGRMISYVLSPGAKK